MEHPDFDKLERLAITGKTAEQVQRLLRVTADFEWEALLNVGWKVSSWEEVREIASHRRARRLLMITERG
jgi:hypothetical protein